MNELFLKIINMSISASWLVLAVLILRFVLKKAPKWVNVLLWGIVAVRLICPFSFESALSLIPSAETIPLNIGMDTTPTINSGINVINNAVNPIISQSNTPMAGASVNPLQITIGIYEYIWIFGMIVLALYTAISYWRLSRKVDTAVRYKDNIFQSENVNSPFVLGIIKPRIYLPFNMNGQDLEHVVAHEQAHIRRKDHLWKPLGFLLLTIHWFNPLMWLAYVLLCRDIELACDEKVIKELGNEQRADYTQALVACSVNRRMIAACPLAFGEVGVKERVKSVMNYKKPAFWIVVLAVIACVVVAVCFLTNPKQDSYTLRIVVPAGSQDEFAYSDEEVSTIKNSIKIWSGDGLGDAEVLLSPVKETTETGYTATYLTHGMPVEFDAEKDTWFKIGVNMQNPTDEDIIVYVEVENVEVRISDESIPDSITFEAEILEVHDGYFLVKPESSWAMNSADQIDVPIQNMNPALEPQVGDIIEIACNGEILETYPARLSKVYSIKVVAETSRLSLNDVIILSQYGYDLTWADFENYDYIETGSGLYIRVYEINELFELWIGGTGLYGDASYPDSAPMYIYLKSNDGTDAKIDIRDGGVTEFISEHNSQSTDSGALIPMVMVDGTLYLDTGHKSTIEARCGVMDGEITSQVHGSQRPTIDDQSNFGSGYGYQYGATEGTIEIYLDGEWRIFATEEVRQKIQFPTSSDELGKFYLTIGAEDVKSIELSMPNSSGGFENADGSLLKKGERIWLENLDGYSDLRGLSITALGENGEIIWTTSIPDGEENKGFTHLVIDDWEITNIE